MAGLDPAIPFSSVMASLMLAVHANQTDVYHSFLREVGPIALYARATNGDLVVIELKKGRAADKVFGQICRYIGCIKEHHSGEGETVRRFIVGREVDEKLKYATKAVPIGLVALQVFDFKGKKGQEEWIQVVAA